MKKALADIEKMEDTLYGSLDKAVADAAKNLQGPWAMVLEGMKARAARLAPAPRLPWSS